MELPHSLDSLKAGRPPTVQGGWVQRPVRQHHEALPVDLPQRHAPGRVLDLGQRLAGRVDPYLQHRQGLDPALDAHRQPVHQPPGSPR
ncbi:MAG: hypothetical protein OXE58_14460 [Acidobacteria bacterium]|nr:hypothetical protein [Acidobacteriota bacterium]